MIWPTTEFIWRETMLQLRRERLIAVSTISTVAVLLVLLGANLLFIQNLQLWTGRAAAEVEVSAYFNKDLDRLDAQRIARTVAAWPEVRQAQFVPREEGWKQLRSGLTSASKLEGLDASILPDAIHVKAVDASQVRGIAKKLATMEGVKTVIPSPEAKSRAGDFAEKMVRFQKTVGLIGLIVAIVVGVAGMFIVHNTVRLALHARWREIYIMQLVGATRALVAAPFLLEGAIHGAVGATVACCLLVPAHMYLRTVAHRAAPFFLLQPDSTLIPFSICMVVGGAVLGVIGSSFSMRRFMRRRPEWHG
jgi:cell division transport system permease protein